MDPVSHAALGYIVVRAVRTPTRRLSAAALIGALAPDIDALAMPFGWDIYLRVHEVGTHALVGTVPVALAAALVARGRTRVPLRPLFEAAWLAVASHVVIDVLSGARIRLGWPFLEARTLLPLVAMAEPWVLGFCVLSALIVFGFEKHAGISAKLLVGVLSACLAVKAMWLAQALDTLPLDHNNPPQARIVEARWATMRQWNVLSKTTTTLTQTRIAPGQAPRVMAEWPVDSDFALSMASRRLETVRNLLAIHELTFAREHPIAGGFTEVLWSDIRFCWRPTPGASDEPNGELALGAGAGRIACALSTGGTFDAAGRAINQRVQVFGQWQTRPAQP